VCSLHRVHGDKESGFLGFISKPRSTVCQWFSLKTTGTVFSSLTSISMVTVSPGLTLKPVARVSRFDPQNRQLWFGDLGLKITVMVSWFGPQNQAGFGLSVLPQNRWEDATAWDTRRYLAAYFTWKQVGLGFPSLV
jgi:hypothetical protein